MFWALKRNADFNNKTKNNKHMLRNKFDKVTTRSERVLQSKQRKKKSEKKSRTVDKKPMIVMMTSFQKATVSIVGADMCVCICLVGKNSIFLFDFEEREKKSVNKWKPKSIIGHGKMYSAPASKSSVFEQRIRSKLADQNWMKF